MGLEITGKWRRDQRRSELNFWYSLGVFVFWSLDRVRTLRDLFLLSDENNFG